MIKPIIQKMVYDFVDRIPISTNRLRVIFIRNVSLAGEEWYVLDILSRYLKEKDVGDGKLENIPIVDVVIVDEIEHSHRHPMVNVDLILRHQIRRDIILKSTEELADYLKKYPVEETDCSFLISSLSDSGSLSRSCSPISSPSNSLASSQEAMA